MRVWLDTTDAKIASNLFTGCWECQELFLSFATEQVTGHWLNLLFFYFSIFLLKALGTSPLCSTAEQSWYFRAYKHHCMLSAAVTVTVFSDQKPSYQDMRCPTYTLYTFGHCCRFIGWNNMDIINNCRQYFDVKLPSGLIVSEGLRKSSLNVTIFFCKISVSIR